jgi:hypothetical protein
MDPALYLSRKKKVAAWLYTHPGEPVPDDIDSIDESNIEAVLPQGALTSPVNQEALTSDDNRDEQGLTVAQRINEAAERHKQLEAERGTEFWSAPGPNPRTVPGSIANLALETARKAQVFVGRAAATGAALVKGKPHFSS